MIAAIRGRSSSIRAFSFAAWLDRVCRPARRNRTSISGGTGMLSMPRCTGRWWPCRKADDSPDSVRCSSPGCASLASNPSSAAVPQGAEGIPRETPSCATNHDFTSDGTCGFVSLRCSRHSRPLWFPMDIGCVIDRLVGVLGSRKVGQSGVLSIVSDTPSFGIAGLPGGPVHFHTPGPKPSSATGRCWGETPSCLPLRT